MMGGSMQSVEMLKDKVHQQLLMLSSGPTEIAQPTAQLGVAAGHKEAQHYTNLRPATASSVVAAAHDPYRTPPQKKEGYGHDP